MRHLVAMVVMCLACGLSLAAPARADDNPPAPDASMPNDAPADLTAPEPSAAIGPAIPAPPPQRKLVIGTKESPPFAMKAEDGTWTGISIELWRQVAATLGVTYEFKEFDLAGVLTAIERREVDVVVAAITINARRERVMDFTHSTYSSGLGIAVLRRSRSGVLATFLGLFSWEFAKVAGGLLVLLAAIGALVWLSERRKNEAQFGGGPVRGIASGLWWSAVTMTTVGYGDKAPVTLVGRILALAWMFTAIIVFSFFTASIASTLTLTQLQSTINGPEDLPGARVATISGSTSAAYLDHRSISYRAVPTVLDGMKAVAAGEIDAMVYDAPILQYTARHALGNAVVVLPGVVKHQAYGFALQEGSPLRESINRALLVEMSTDRWHALVEYYVGE